MNRKNSLTAAVAAFGLPVLMLIGTARAENPVEIELQPVSKFPVIRDLMVNRARMFHALEKVYGWVPVDGYHDAGRLVWGSGLLHHAREPGRSFEQANLFQSCFNSM